MLPDKQLQWWRDLGLPAAQVLPGRPGDDELWFGPDSARRAGIYLDGVWDGFTVGQARVLAHNNPILHFQVRLVRDLIEALGDIAYPNQAPEAEAIMDLLSQFKLKAYDQCTIFISSIRLREFLAL